MYTYIYIYIIIITISCTISTTTLITIVNNDNIIERFPHHWHLNLKAFREHIRNQVSDCFVTEEYVYNISGLGVRVVWTLFNYNCYHC